MTQHVDIEALAKLARLEVRDEELKKLEREIPEILAFVEAIQSVETEPETNAPQLRNVVRADKNPHEGGLHTKTLLDAAPAREGDRIAVKQVVSRKR